jgi:dTDP-4-dehydrorhamnose reductase
MLARDIVRTKPATATLKTRSRAELDIRDTVAFERAAEESRPDWVFNCAAFTRVDDAEADRETAFAVNATAVERMAAVCATRNVRLLHFSTDYVFDGGNRGFYSVDDAPHPINAYGESKLAGEVAIERSGVRYLLIRPQWLFGVHGRSFVGLMYDRARAGQATRVVADQMGCCTYTVDLARATWDLIGRTEGIVHIANRGKVSRYDLAARIFEHFGAESFLSPCSVEEFGSTPRRPANSALSVRRAEQLLGREMPAWDDALARYLAERSRH